MPTYQYQCTDCQQALEVHQSFSEDALTVCPSCEGRLRKVFNAVGVVFKGSGFYRNDSRSTTGSSEGGSSDTASSSSSSSSSDSGSGSAAGGSGASAGTSSSASAPTPA